MNQIKIVEDSSGSAASGSTTEAPKTKQTNVKKLVKEKFVQWSESSTSHGYPNIFKSKNLAVKIMWGLFFVSFTGIGTYMVVRGIFDYFKYEVTSTIRVLKNDTLTFPTVTICHTNPFASDAGTAFILDYFRRTYSPNITSYADVVKYTNSSNAELEILRQLVADPSFEGNRESFGYDAYDMLYYCSFNLQSCDYGAFEKCVTRLIS